MKMNVANTSKDCIRYFFFLFLGFKYNLNEKRACSTLQWLQMFNLFQYQTPGAKNICIIYCTNVQICQNRCACTPYQNVFHKRS